jgi:beta-glucosidase
MQTTKRFGRAGRLLVSTATVMIFALLAGSVQAADVKALLGQMTLEEKMALIRGEYEPMATNQGQAGFLPGVPRLNIPSLRFADGPPGLLTKIPSPALTATMGLAATFSKEDARQNGVIVGDESIRLGIDVALQPFVNIDRDISFSRAYNTYGEDPVLSGVMGAGLIEGIQSRDVMAQVKHYIGYDTNGSDVTIDMQTLHEVYLAPFDDAIKANVSSIMCSYNRINGPYACDSKELLVDVLRGELGFKGFVTSDWGAIHDYDYLAHGLDMEMPGLVPKENPQALFSRSYFATAKQQPLPLPKFDVDMASVFTGGIPEEAVLRQPFGGAFPMPSPDYKIMADALKEGVVTETMIDRAAARVLGEMDRFGYLDGSRTKVIGTRSGLDAASVILKTSEDAAVLLKNEGNLLPLAPGKSGSIALIGPGAAQVASIGKSGERSVGLPERQVGPFDALKKVLSNADLRLAVANDMTGQPVPAAVLTQDSKTPGLVHTVDGKPAGIDAAVDFTHQKALAPKSSHVWEGVLTVSSSGRYILAIQTLGTRGNIYIDGKKVTGTSGFTGGWHGDIVQAGQDGVFPTPDHLNNSRAAVELSAGAHKLKITAVPDISDAPVQVRFNWATPEQQTATRAAAIAAAKEAKTAVVFVWSRDIPAFGLPGDQDKLVEEVAAVNPNTIVVLNVSQPIAMPWIDKVKGVVQMWWPGDEGGWATANVLAGKKNPAGRLPFTWAKRLEDYASHDPAHPERAAQGFGAKVRFSEGVDVGYRWFDKKSIAPLYPFGYGLSYSSFAYSGLKVAPAKDGGFDIRFTVKNTGGVDGEEVPQVYVSAPAKPVTGAQFAVNALAGFDRVYLKAGEAKPVSIHIDRRRTQYWSVAAKKWVDSAATRQVSVGASSRDLRLKAALPRTHTKA